MDGAGVSTSMSVELDLEALVAKYGDEMVTPTLGPSNVMKITCILALFSCTMETITKFHHELTHRGNISIIAFTLEEKNKFGRLQIVSNHIRKCKSLIELPLMHLSPRLVMAALIMEMEKKSLHDIYMKAEEKFQREQKEQEEKEKENEKETNKIVKKKNKKQKKSTKQREIRVMKPETDEDDLPPAPFLEETINDFDEEPEEVNNQGEELSQLETEVLDDGTLRTTFFQQELDPTDTEGWVPVTKKKEVEVLPKKEIENPPKKAEIPPKKQIDVPAKKNQIVEGPRKRSADRPPSTKSALTSPPHKKELPLPPQSIVFPTVPRPISPPLPPPPTLSPISQVTCQKCQQLSNEIDEMKEKHLIEMHRLRSKYEEEIQDLREFHSQAIQSLQLKLFIANNNLDMEREERDKIIEEMINKYRIEAEEK